jgi:hypothetical protein
MHRPTNSENAVSHASKSINEDTEAQSTLSLEAYRKLNRSQELAYFLGADLRKKEIDGLTPFYLPHLLSYLDEDLCFVLDELKEKGMCGSY